MHTHVHAFIRACSSAWILTPASNVLSKFLAADASQAPVSGKLARAFIRACSSA